MRLKQAAFILTAFTVGIVFAYAALTVGTPPPVSVGAVWQYTDRVFVDSPPLPLPPLSEIVGDAETDADALTAIVNYYERQSHRLAFLFAEDSDERARALFGMYIIHMAAPYNATPITPVTFLDFVHTPTAHCGIYAQAQAQLYTALGLRWHNVIVDNGWHGLIEAEIDGAWEVFDSTSNVWVSVGVEQLLSGAVREYRAFYAPVEDRAAPDVYRDHLQAGFSVPELRGGLPLWGLSVFPRQMEIIDQSAGTRSAAFGL